MANSFDFEDFEFETVDTEALVFLRDDAKVDTETLEFLCGKVEVAENEENERMEEEVVMGFNFSEEKMEMDSSIVKNHSIKEELSKKEDDDAAAVIECERLQDQKMAVTSDLSKKQLNYGDLDELENKDTQNQVQGNYSKTETKKEPVDSVDGTNGYMCEICSKCLKTRRILGMHRKNHFRERVKCPECEQTFSLAKSLRRHMLTHKGEEGKTFYCDECGKSFIRPSDLAGHQLRVHSERLKCSQCEKTFYSSEHLKAHSVITHGADYIEGVEFYRCEHCDKRFVKSGELRRHRLTHTGERNYTCTTCGKAFPQKAHLIGHSRVHSSEKLFSCENCPKTFKTQSTLNRHNSLKHKSNMFRCFGCDFTSNKQSSLEEHMKMHRSEAWHMQMMAMIQDQGTVGQIIRGIQ